MRRFSEDAKQTKEDTKAEKEDKKEEEPKKNEEIKEKVDNKELSSDIFGEMFTEVCELF